MKKLKKIGLLATSLVVMGSVSYMPLSVHAQTSAKTTQTISSEKQEEALKKFLGTSTNNTKTETVDVVEYEEIDEYEEVIVDSSDFAIDVDLSGEFIEESDGEDVSIFEEVEESEEFVEDVVDGFENETISDFDEVGVELENSDEIVLEETVFEDEFNVVSDEENVDEIHNSADESLDLDDMNEEVKEIIADASDFEVLDEVSVGFEDENENTEYLTDEDTTEEGVVSEDENEVEESEVVDAVESDVQTELDVSSVSSTSLDEDMISLIVDAVEGFLIIFLLVMYSSLKGRVNKLEKYHTVVVGNAVRPNVAPSVQPTVNVQSSTQAVAPTVVNTGVTQVQQPGNNQGQLQ